MRIAALILFAALSNPVAAADCTLCGKWRSNAAKTLADIEARVPTYPASLRKMFGTMTIEYTATKVRAVAHSDSKANAAPWSPYTLEKRPPGQPQILRTADADGKWQEAAIEFSEDCYRVLIPTRQGPGFHEYFCRTTK
jgi:hypothetical protein